MKKNDLPIIFRLAGYPEPIKEYRFDAKRRWRFDFCWPDYRLAVEWEGIFAAKSRHTSLTGYTKDCEKYNSAAHQDWRVIRVTAMMKQSYLLDLLDGAFLVKGFVGCGK